MNFTFFKRQRVPFTNIQKIKPGIHSVVAYEVVKVAQFFIVFQGGRGLPRRILNFWIFRKKQSAMELFIFIFQNNSPKGSFGWNKINYEILQLSAHSRYLQSGPLKASL